MSAKMFVAPAASMTSCGPPASDARRARVLSPESYQNTSCRRRPRRSARPASDVLLLLDERGGVVGTPKADPTASISSHTASKEGSGRSPSSSHPNGDRYDAMPRASSSSGVPATFGSNALTYDA